MERIRYFISDFKLRDLPGNTTGILDTIELENASGTFVTEDNFAKVDRDIFQASTLGTFIGAGKYTGVEFNVGLLPEISSSDPVTSSSSHALYIQNDSLLYDSLSNNFLSSLVIFNPDTISTTDSTEIKLMGLSKVEINFGQQIEIYEGFNVNIVIAVDYLTWFKNVNVYSSNTSEIETQILQNLPNAFRIVEIKLE